MRKSDRTVEPDSFVGGDVEIDRAADANRILKSIRGMATSALTSFLAGLILAPSFILATYVVPETERFTLNHSLLQADCFR